MGNLSAKLEAWRHAVRSQCGPVGLYVTKAQLSLTDAPASGTPSKLKGKHRVGGHGTAHQGSHWEQSGNLFEAAPAQIAQPAPEPPQKHYYAGTVRPIGEYTVPEGATGFRPHFHYDYGLAEYDHPISEEDRRHYSLVKVPASVATATGYHHGMPVTVNVGYRNEPEHQAHAEIQGNPTGERLNVKYTKHASRFPNGRYGKVGTTDNVHRTTVHFREHDPAAAPESLDGNPQALAIYNGLDHIPATTFQRPADVAGKAALALKIDAALREHAPANWQGDEARERQVLNALFPIMSRDRAATQAIFDIVAHKDVSGLELARDAQSPEAAPPVKWPKDMMTIEGPYDRDRFNSEWEAGQKVLRQNIQASKRQGNTHVDQLPFGVEAMRGRFVQDMWDGRRGMITSCDNHHNVYIAWHDGDYAGSELLFDDPLQQLRVIPTPPDLVKKMAAQFKDGDPWLLKIIKRQLPAKVERARKPETARDAQPSVKPAAPAKPKKPPAGYKVGKYGGDLVANPKSHKLEGVGDEGNKVWRKWLESMGGELGDSDGDFQDAKHTFMERYLAGVRGVPSHTFAWNNSDLMRAHDAGDKDRRSGSLKGIRKALLVIPLRGEISKAAPVAAIDGLHVRVHDPHHYDMIGQRRRREPGHRLTPPPEPRPTVHHSEPDAVQHEVLTQAHEYATKGTHSRAFLAWFGDWAHDPENASKVVKTDGSPQENYEFKPIVAYHGTPKGGYTSFDPQHLNAGALHGPGFYFTEDLDVAKEYARQEAEGQTNRGVYAVYLNIRHPFDYDAALPISDAERLVSAVHDLDDGSYGGMYATMNAGGFARYAGSLYGSGQEITGLHLYEYLSLMAGKARANEILQAAGFDGITHVGGHIMGDHEHRVWIAFRANQIKALRNIGSFDPATDDIYKALAVQVRKLRTPVGLYLIKSLQMSLFGDDAPLKGHHRIGGTGSEHQGSKWENTASEPLTPVQKNSIINGEGTDKGAIAMDKGLPKEVFFNVGADKYHAILWDKSAGKERYYIKSEKTGNDFAVWHVGSSTIDKAKGAWPSAEWRADFKESFDAAFANTQSHEANIGTSEIDRLNSMLGDAPASPPLVAPVTESPMPIAPSSSEQSGAESEVDMLKSLYRDVLAAEEKTPDVAGIAMRYDARQDAFLVSIPRSGNERVLGKELWEMISRLRGTSRDTGITDDEVTALRAYAKEFRDSTDIAATRRAMAAQIAQRYPSLFTPQRQREVMFNQALSAVTDFELGWGKKDAAVKAIKDAMDIIIQAQINQEKQDFDNM